ncbi:MAG: phosphoribosylformylglycinamidine synthase [Lachnospiraceae bacterium]|nr:phosphoribosylformylglycinamidine synthase [Lachnospiraceae bacterium]
MSVQRIYVEKRPGFAVQARELKEEVRGYLGIAGLEDVRVLIRYDVEGVSPEIFSQALTTIFSEPPVDDVYPGEFPRGPQDKVFSVEYLPGQFDQRADSAEQCVRLLNAAEEPVVRTATTYVLTGDLSEEDVDRIRRHCINPVDSREASEEVPETLVTEFDEPADVIVYDGFSRMEEAPLKELYNSLGLAMTFRDFLHIQKHFREEEHRDPSHTEIRVLDTYWSDHCRHTTFLTELKDVAFEEGYAREAIEESYDRYIRDRESIFAGRKDKFVCLMDLALMGARKLKAEGKLRDQEETDEINACSIVVPVEIDGKEEEWLVNFKNETHNHPTEIEPFGGAATCLGGAIRDPLSGRTYVYQAMRVTGAADPTVSASQTMKGKLPQKKLVREAAHGYSSYGNQIGLATGYVKEIYHPNYAAKRMEIGAVVGAAPRKNVIRMTSDPGDIIILLGGRTGRDGCGGATGSSKIHTESSIETCGAEVQKGNAPTERKLQRLFRRGEVSRLIKKCNDFGAGGVSVAIGELAAGLDIDLDLVPKKYAGLDGTEIAISESQERMAVVVDPKDKDAFLAFADEENLEATPVAVVTELPRLRMHWRGKTIVDLSRAFLDTNGAHQEASVVVEMPEEGASPFKAAVPEDVEAGWKAMLADLNVCSQRGLVEMFDSSIGAGSVLMPYGGKYQRTETQAMVAKLPVLSGKCSAVTMMSYGFDPVLSSWSPYHGSMYAVLTSIAKIAAAGGDPEKIRFTFQEYFRRMTEDPHRWSQPFAALLGAYEAQMRFGLPSIGGKDSMSGSFGEMDVPPTLVSFAVDVADLGNVVSPEFKEAGNTLYLIEAPKKAFDLPDCETAMEGLRGLHAAIQAGGVRSAYVLERHGLAEAVSKAAFGNRIGAALCDDVTAADLFAPAWGSVLVEAAPGFAASASWREIGVTTAAPVIRAAGAAMALSELQEIWEKPLEKVFPSAAGGEGDAPKDALFDAKTVYVGKEKAAKPRVFIPVFPGTNCEYDSARAFERAGAQPVVRVYRNLTAEGIRASVEDFSREIGRAQMIMFPGGFSAGDEPEGSAKFFATAFRNEKMKEAVLNLLEKRDGLVLGVCNGFQALIKLGLVPYGTIRPQEKDSPTLTYNTIGRHVSHMVYTKVVSNKSPWLMQAQLGGVYTIPASHGEGRFVADEAWLKKLFEAGQVATQYCTPDGEVSMDGEWNVNGSFAAVEGILSPDGRVFGKMGHSERRSFGTALNIVGEQDMRLFESGTAYFG